MWGQCNLEQYNKLLINFAFVGTLYKRGLSFFNTSASLFLCFLLTCWIRVIFYCEVYELFLILLIFFF